MQNIADIRKNYMQSSLDLNDVSKDPLKQFQSWFEEAMNAGVQEVNAMTLSTVSEKGTPSARIVLLKGLEDAKFTFFTNYQSRKGLHMEKNAAVALTFFWAELERQVRIEGIVEKISPETSEQYFQSRPKASQIGAWASPQSAVIANRGILEERVNLLEKKHSEDSILPCPKQWGGYAVTAEMIEFWQGRPNRLHDRLLYLQEGENWKIKRLAP